MGPYRSCQNGAILKVRARQVYRACEKCGISQLRAAQVFPIESGLSFLQPFQNEHLQPLSNAKCQMQEEWAVHDGADAPATWVIVFFFSPVGLFVFLSFSRLSLLM